ncbi:MAG: type II toxin-antitoxin system VapC family toxin [Microbacteriaceae bacterium]
MTSLIALDTSVAVPLLLQSHRAHALVVDWWKGRDVALSGHAAAETYSVLTRLPGDARLDPADAARLLTERFAPPLLMTVETAQQLPVVLAGLGIAGGAVYDAIVALAAAEHHCALATRDARAKTTYDTVGVRVELVV